MPGNKCNRINLGGWFLRSQSQSRMTWIILVLKTLSKGLLFIIRRTLPPLFDGIRNSTKDITGNICRYITRTMLSMFAFSLMKSKKLKHLGIIEDIENNGRKHNSHVHKKINECLQTRFNLLMKHFLVNSSKVYVYCL